MQRANRSSWLERRVGSRGDGWAAIRNALLALLSDDTTSLEPVGLDEAELAHFRQAHRLDDLAAHFPTRGDAVALVRIARFGAQLAAIACAAARIGAHTTILVEGALFNLGVALFDTLVDDQPARLHSLAGCLEASCIWHHLVLGVPLPPCGDPAAELIVSLFRHLFDSFRRRLLQPELELLARRLIKMYRAEVVAPAKVTDAKTLPTAFFGEYVGGAQTAPTMVMERLGLLLALLDDWNDLSSDIVALQPNIFLGGDTSTKSIRYGLFRVWRTVGGEASHSQIAGRLVQALREALTTAREANPDCATLVIGFVGDLLDRGAA